MTILTEIVKNVLVIILLTSFLEILLPEGRTKPFVRFAIGLFVLIAVLNPVLTKVLHINKLEVATWDYQQPEDQAAQEQMSARGRAMQQQITQTSSQVVKDKLQGQISAVAVLVPGVKTVKTEAEVDKTGNVNKLYLTVSETKLTDAGDNQVNTAMAEEAANTADTQDEIKTKIIDLVKNLYGFQDKQIEIEFEGG